MSEETEQITKEIYGTKYYLSSGAMKEFDARTHKFVDVPETGVYGRFARLRQLNAFKSRSAGKPVYDEITGCMIKLDNISKDVITKIVNKKNEALLAERFKTSWDEFKKLESEHAKKAAKKD